MNLKKQNNKLVTMILMIGLALPMLLSGSRAVSAQAPLAVRSIQWNTDGSLLAVGYKNGEVEIITVATGEVVKTLQVASSDVFVNALAWTLYGRQLATGDSTGKVIIWDTEHWQPIVTLTDADGGIVSLTWNADETNLIAFTVGNLGFLRWDADSDFQLLETDYNRGRVTQIAWNSSRTQVATGIPTGAYIFNDPLTFEILTYAEEAFLTALAWSPNDNLVGTGNSSGTVKLWSPTTLQAISTLKIGVQTTDVELETIIAAVAFSIDGEQLYAVQGDGTLLTWDLTSYRLHYTQTVSANPIVTAQFNPNGTKLAYAGETGRVEIIEVVALNSPKMGGAITALVWDNTGTSLAVGHSNGQLEIAYIDGRPSLSLVGHTAGINDLAWQPNGSMLASGSSDGTIDVWETDSGTLLKSFSRIDRPHFTSVGNVLWSLDGSQLWVNAVEGDLIIWDVQTWQQATPIDFGLAAGLRWNRDGTVLLAGSGTVAFIADPESLPIVNFIGEPVSTFITSDQVFSVNWSPDERYVVGGSPNGRVRVWDVASEQVVLDTGTEADYDPSYQQWRQSFALLVAFTSDGQQVQALNGRGMFRTWDIASGELISETQFPVSQTPIEAAAFSPDGTKIAYGDASGAFQIVDILSEAIPR